MRRRSRSGSVAFETGSVVEDGSGEGLRALIGDRSEEPKFVVVELVRVVEPQCEHTQRAVLGNERHGAKA